MGRNKNINDQIQQLLETLKRCTVTKQAKQKRTFSEKSLGLFSKYTTLFVDTVEGLQSLRKIDDLFPFFDRNGGLIQMFFLEET